MDAAPLDALCAALDAEVVQLRDLVDVCPREQAHVIAFETAELSACVEAKLTLTREIEAQEQACRARMADLAVAVGLTPGPGLTVTGLALRLTDPARAELLDRATRLRSLAGALQELQAMTSLLTNRGRDVLRACLDGLTSPGARGAAPLQTYTAHGRKRQEPIAKRDLLTNV